MGSSPKWNWLSLAVLVGAIGCGGSGGRGAAAVPGVLANTWVGIVDGSDGSDPNLLITISATGVISGVEEIANGSLGPDGTGPHYNETGMVQRSGQFTMIGTSPGLPNRVITGVVSLNSDNALAGSGTMTSGSTQMTVTFTLSGKGTDTSGE